MGFERCHPAVNLIYFAAVITGAIAFQHPVFLVISYVCASAYCAKRSGWKGVLFNAALLPLAVAFSLYYSSIHHFGVTVLGYNAIGNNMTLESAVYGLVLGLSIVGIMIWFSCIYSVFSTDKMVYLFGRISPRLSLFLAIMLRLVPRVKQEALRIHTAQCGIGRGVYQGNVLQRIRNFLRIFSMLITWTIESLSVASQSMRSRGSSLRGRKAFSIYRFDDRDRAFVIAMFTCLTLTLMAVILKQTDILYDPKIVFPKATPVTWLFYIGYGVLCLMPLGLELWTDYRFTKARRAL